MRVMSEHPQSSLDEIKRLRAVVMQLEVETRHLKIERGTALATLDRVQALLGDTDRPLWSVRGVREADLRAALEEP